MAGYIVNIAKAARENNNFRQVLHTAKNSQLVVMSLKPGEEIGEEVHNLDQFLRVETGECKAILDGVESKVEAGFAVVVPAGVKHNIVNGPASEMKLYTIYSPPQHRDGVVHQTREQAMADNEHYGA